MTADALASDDGRDPITLALQEGDVRVRLLQAACAALGRSINSLSALQIKAEAEEIVQNAIVEVLKKRHTYDGDGDIVTWMNGYIYNVARDHLRKLARRPTDALQLEDFIADLRRSVTDALEVKDLVERVLAQLKPDERRLIEMKYFEDFTCAEIAAQLDMNEGTVRVKLHRIIAQLRQLAIKPGEVQS
jgi:RNA polymerase sigma-70 factor (ECF subfamily)